MKLLIFEGIDGTGKTTLAVATYNMLTKNGYKCISFREPGGTEAGERIRNILATDKTISDMTRTLLLFAGREEIYRYLDEHNDYDFVIFDRNHYSTYAYQTSDDKIKNIYNILLNKKYYDLEECIVFLDIDPLQAKQKRDKDKDAMELKGLNMQMTAYRNYQKIFKDKKNVLYLKTFDTLTNLDLISNYLNIGDDYNDHKSSSNR